MHCLGALTRKQEAFRWWGQEGVGVRECLPSALRILADFVESSPAFAVSLVALCSDVSLYVDDQIHSRAIQ